MSQPISRMVAVPLIFVLAYTPVLASFTGTLAAAQTQNTTSNYLYDGMGNLTQVTDPLSHVTNISYDALNRVKQRIQPVPATGLARPTSNFAFDALDQLSTISDPRVLTTTYTTDGLGNQSALSSPDTGLTGRTYDSAGNVLTSTDARGKVTSYTYDALNRVTSISFQTGTPVTLEYDGGSVGAPNALGRLTGMSDESGHTSYGYDQMGRVISKVQNSVSAAGTVSRTVSYAYDGNGKLSSLTYPSGNRVNYSYDAAGRVSNLTLNPSDANGGTDTSTAIVLLDQIGYAPFGAAQSWVWGNNSATAPNVYARTFDLDGRISSYPLGNLAAATPGILRTLTYDAASRITAMTHTGNTTAPAYNQSLTYDGLDRLLSYSTGSASQGYAYDANGNRTQFSIGASNYTHAVSTTSNRLNSTSGPYPAKNDQYDAAGNLSTDGTIAYTYSDRGRMKTSTNAGITTSYLYNGLGQRVSKTNSIVPTGGNEYVYDEAGHLLGEYDATGAVVQETVFLGDMPVAVLKQASTGTPPAVTTATYYVYADHINTPRVIADSASGAIVWNWTAVDPFGLGAPDENPGGIGSFTYNPRFPGQLFDRETNNHYNYLRDYDPQTGRYMQSDPIGADGGINTYSYVGGNPLMFVDPYGLWKWGDPINQSVVDAVAGFGDGASLGMTVLVRGMIGANDAVDFASGSYIGGLAAGTVVAAIGIKRGPELSIGKNIRIAPWGNRTGNPYGEWPHYHRRGTPDVDGKTPPGQGIARHRPWEQKSTDKNICDRF